MAQQARATATRRAVIEAAAKVFDSKGFAAATIADIIEAGGITKGALYFHFPSKEELAKTVIEEQSTWQVAQAVEDQRPMQEVIDISFRFAHGLQVDPLIRASIRLTLEYGTFSAADPAPYQDWVARIAELLAQERADGNLRDGVDISKASRLLASSVTGAQMFSQAMTQRKDLPEYLEYLWQIVLPGLVTPAYLEQLSYGVDRMPAAE